MNTDIPPNYLDGIPGGMKQPQEYQATKYHCLHASFLKDSVIKNLLESIMHVWKNACVYYLSRPQGDHADCPAER